MRIIFDHNVDRRFRRYLTGHEVNTTREMRWDSLANGKLLRAATDAHFDIFLSIDKKIEHEQNLLNLPLPILILDSLSNALPSLIPFSEPIMAFLQTPFVPALYVMKIDGTVQRIVVPRSRT